MPEVVSKVTQQSMGFTAATNSETSQQTSTQKNMMMVRGSRDISGDGQAINQQYQSDLGSSYKSGLNVTDTTAVLNKTGSSLSKVAASSLQPQTQPTPNIPDKQQENNKRLNTYIRQRELSNFIRRDEAPNQGVNQ